ncbi:MAG: hypothetical protein GY778_28660 [bacterium]|nr:hypothetical protein [bacterium]
MTSKPFIMTPQKRRRRWIRRLAVGLVGLLGLSWITIEIVGHIVLDRQIDAIGRSYGASTYSSLQAHQEPIAPDENGALVYLKLVDRLDALGDQYGRSAALPLLGGATLPAFGQPYPVEALEALSRVVAEQETLIADLTRLSEYPSGRFPLDDLTNETWFAHAGSALRSAKLLYLHTINELSMGQFDGTARDVATLFNLAAYLGEDPDLMSFLRALWLQRYSMELLELALSVGSLSEDDLLLLSDSVRRAFVSTSPWTALQGVRLVMMQTIEAGGGDPRGFTSFDNSWIQSPRWYYRVFGGWQKMQQAKALELIGPFCEQSLTVRDYLQRSRQLDDIYANLPTLYFVAWLAMPHLDRTMVLHGRGMARLRCTYLAIGAERYRMDHGQWPATLNQLVPNYVEYLPIDPFDEQPLRYQRATHGVTIYSVSDDLQDHGGALERLTVPRREAPDVGFRLVDPDRRQFKVVTSTLSNED